MDSLVQGPTHTCPAAGLPGKQDAVASRYPLTSQFLPTSQLCTPLIFCSDKLILVMPAART